jgi:ABC-type transport system substrate-binding protein
MPDPAAPTLAGAGVRALVLPQLFVAGANGRWLPSLVEPGSDRGAADGLSASFRLRAGAKWSSGVAVGVEDLRRSADARFVAGVDGPDGAGRVTVRFVRPLPGWRRLWSGVGSVSAPAPGVWGGPFVVAEMTPGLETVLRRNDSWWGAPQPYLDEVRLVLVPDVVMQRQLFERGELDVVAPLATSNRSGQFGGDAVVGRPSRPSGPSGPSGWDVRLVLNGARLDEGARRALAGAVDRRLFVDSLLAGEASVLDGWAGPEDGTWRSVGVGDVGALGGLQGKTVVLTGEIEEPITPWLQRAVQRAVSGAGGTVELRNAEADRVEGWVAAGDYDAAVVVAYEGPNVCWVCRWPGAEAESADAGDVAAAAALEGRLRDSAVVLPLWRPAPFVAARPGIEGPSANGFGLTAAWNAWEWHRP